MKLNGNIFIGKSFIPGTVEFEEKFTGLEFGDTKSSDYIVPGFVDIHTHGACGCDFSDSDGDIDAALKFYASKGVTSVLSTIMTLPENDIISSAGHIFPYAAGSCSGEEKNTDIARTKIAGIHLEGPFISGKKKGAHNADHIIKPDADTFIRMIKGCGGLVRLVTYAPEEDTDLAFTKEFSKVMALSAGHSACDYDTAVKAFNAGCDHLTHMFNAMPELSHRNKGLIDAAYENGIYAELIADGVHVSDLMIKMAFDMFPERICLISDSLPCAGLSDGTYSLGGEEIILKDGVAKRPDGTLAGSVIGLLDAVKHCTETGISLEDAVYAASTAPAVSARISGIGRISQGYHADLTVLDHNLNIKAVFVNGKKII